jgi:hypothetical protein
MGRHNSTGLSPEVRIHATASVVVPGVEGEKHFKGLTKYFMWLVWLCCVGV